MTCPNCAAARTDPHWPGYQAGCRPCRVRALASGPTFFQAAQAGRQTPAYRAALQSLLGEDWKAAHEEVKAEHLRVQKLKSTKAAGVPGHISSKKG